MAPPSVSSSAPRTTATTATNRTTPAPKSNSADPTAASQDAVFQAYQKMMESSPSESLTPENREQYTQAVVGQTKNAYASFMGNLGEATGKATQEKIDKKVNEYLRDHPNASLDDIKKNVKDIYSKESSSAYIFKSIIDKSMNDIMAKAKAQAEQSW
ncbi:hypothetical protein DRW03_01840 [Corallococcus sp. H22C18031201]|uniref:hypothetical protein n=1 Tax=Citreicoccus inhibens TaxID=2849499 RepID=UPI000E753EDB|nr:hypothetical protein [Citreicoccus inhibens]MBU8894985.1 hypothetical protein [Citreicoccus inhibens]RJS27142.1 hypothetical protein DRW03_01840 [Corallococcus sp. H22C18031201]